MNFTVVQTAEPVSDSPVDSELLVLTNSLESTSERGDVAVPAVSSEEQMQAAQAAAGSEDRPAHAISPVVAVIAAVGTNALELMARPALQSEQLIEKLAFVVKRFFERHCVSSIATLRRGHRVR